MKVYKVWCEYDMGACWEERIFSSREKAESSFGEVDWSIIDECDWEKAMKSGLLTIREVELE